MENIRKEVKSVLPTLSEPLLDAILERLRSKGVDTRDDLQFVQEDDIVDLIKPIHCRRLLCTWKETGMSFTCKLKSVYKKEHFHRICFFPPLFHLVHV